MTKMRRFFEKTTQKSQKVAPNCQKKVVGIKCSFSNINL